MPALLTLAGKDLLLLLRDKTAVFTSLGFPILYSVFFGAIFGGMSGGRPAALDIAVVDEDRSEASQRFAQRLRDTDEFKVRDATADESVGLVRRGKCVGAITLAAGFGAKHDHPFRDGLPQVRVGMDPSRKAEAGLITGLLARHLFESIADRFRDRSALRGMIADTLGWVRTGDGVDSTWRGPLELLLPTLDTFVATMPGVDAKDGDAARSAESSESWDPIAEMIQMSEIRRQGVGPKTAYDISFPQGVIWGLLGCVGTFTVSLVVERTRGTLTRLRASPVSAGAILAGKGLACFISSVVVAGLMLGAAMAVFGVRPHSYVLLFCAIACTSLCFVGVMMFLSVLGKTEQSAGGIAWGIMSVMAMIGGAMVPLMFLPSWMRFISNISPVKWAIYAMEGAIWRGLGPAEMVTPCAILVGIGVASFLAGARLFQWNEAT